MEHLRLILLVVINNHGAAGILSHPIHLHGHNMFVLDVGEGSWDGTTVINPANPQRRDVQLLPSNGYMVLQITADNPGAWPLHCHIVSFYGLVPMRNLLINHQ